MPRVKTTTVEPDVFNDLENFRPPAKWYIVDALGNKIFIHCRNRADAISYVKDEYGGKYSVRTDSNGGSSGGEQSAKGYINSKSRAGSRPVD